MKKLNILFIINLQKDETFSVSEKILAFLKEKNVNVFAEKDIANHFDTVTLFTNQKIDFALVLGGDGTLLHAAHNYKEYDFPFFGINIGRVGCLTGATMKDYESRLEEIIQGNYDIEERNVINCKVYDKNKLLFDKTAFNEVSIHRAGLYKMLLVNMHINGKNKTSFYADGVLVATSTGSSAYNLSSGGPLLLPTAKNFVITPISPQLRVITSLVVNDTEKITFDLKDKDARENYDSYHPTVFIDGAFRYELNADSVIEITKSDKVFKIITLERDNSLFDPIYKVSLVSSEMFTKK